MTSDICPRCGHDSGATNIGHPLEVVHWNCGTYREPSGNLYESELCETRQELRIQRDIAVQFEIGAALLIERAEKAEAGLAKLEKALDESYDYCDKVTSLTIFGHSFKEAHEMAAREMPNYAEWLKSRQ